MQVGTLKLSISDVPLVPQRQIHHDNGVGTSKSFNSSGSSKQSKGSVSEIKKSRNPILLTTKTRQTLRGLDFSEFLAFLSFQEGKFRLILARRTLLFLRND